MNWEGRDYQTPILYECKNSRRLVMRLGRRLGKTECQCISILWHGFAQPNAKHGDPNFTYNILVLAPYEKQIDLIYKRLNELIDNSPMYTSLIKKRKQHYIELNNGCTILGLTLGASSGEGSSTRGQKASLIMLDEVDYMGTKPISNVMNIANEDPGRIKVIASSTPSGKHEEFYHWCMGATKTYKPKQEDVENFKFTGYEVETKDRGNGWVQVYSPSTVNKTILEINPDTNQTYLQDIKDQLSELRFEQEVMANFGNQELGVYKHEYIDEAIALGLKRNHKYWEEYTSTEKANFFTTRFSKILIAAVDWDISQATPNILCLCYDKLDKDVNGDINPIFKVLFRVDIPRTEFTLDDAVKKIIELNKEFNFDHIIMDRGMGDMQLEVVKRYGLEHPDTGLHLKTEGIYFGSKVDVRDPYTNEIINVDFKPFMVNNSVRVFERGFIMLNERDKVLTRQLNAYKIENISTTGRPVYSSEDEHSVDTLNLALYKFFSTYTEEFNQAIKGIVSKVTLDNNVKEEWVNRCEKIDDSTEKEIIIQLNDHEVIYTSVPVKKHEKGYTRSYGQYSGRKSRFTRKCF